MCTGVTFSLRATVLCIVLFGCSPDPGVVLPPDRPKNVPSDAIWVGGLDGGVFLDLKKISDQVAQGTVYTDLGDIFYRGRLEITEGQIDFPLNSMLAYQGWDGENMMLRDGRLLASIDPPTWE